VCEGGEVGDVVGLRVFGADGGNTCVRSLAGLGEGIVAGVEVLAFLYVAH
jgi:hypothetical protein